MAQPAMRITHTSSRQALHGGIIESLNTLPSLLRTVFIMSHYQNRSVAQISAELALPEAIIEEALQDANRIFYRHLAMFR